MVTRSTECSQRNLSRVEPKDWRSIRRKGEVAVTGYLQHMVKSLKNLPWHAIITPVACRKCGFAFHKDKVHKPGRCPRCHGTWISAPLIRIEERR